MAGGGAGAAGELPEGGFLKAARLIYSNQNGGKTPVPARRRERMTIKAYQRSGLLGAFLILAGAFAVLTGNTFCRGGCSPCI